MTEQQYRVIADRDKGGDISAAHADKPGDRLIYKRDSNGVAILVRIERPVPTTEEPVRDATPEEIAASLLPPCGFDTEAYAQAHNDGYDAAVAQELQDHPAAFAAALRAAADRIEQEQRPSVPTREQLAETRDRIAKALCKLDMDLPWTPNPQWQAQYFERADTVLTELALIQNGSDR